MTEESEETFESVIDDDLPQMDRLRKKTRESPMMVIGIAAFTVIVAVGLYRFKSRPENVSASVYLTQLRVISQGAVVGALTGSMIYQLGADLFGSSES